MNRIATGCVLIATAAALAMAAAPQGWHLAGSKPANYDTGVDPSTFYNGMPSAFLKAKADQEGFGTLMQTFGAANYAGTRVRLTAYVKSDGVARWAGLWMRIDGSGSPPRPLGFDNMQNRPIKGSTGWQQYQVVLDVPQEAKDIALGILLDGPGEVWMSGADVQTVGPEVATTNLTQQKLADAPVNLGFRQ